MYLDSLALDVSTSADLSELSNAKQYSVADPDIRLR